MVGAGDEEAGMVEVAERLEEQREPMATGDLTARAQRREDRRVLLGVRDVGQSLAGRDHQRRAAQRRGRARRLLCGLRELRQPPGVHDRHLRLDQHHHDPETARARRLSDRLEVLRAPAQNSTASRPASAARRIRSGTGAPSSANSHSMQAERVNVVMSS